MIITCPSCAARFAVSAEAIGAVGRKVRCAKCKHDWFQEANEESLAAAAAVQPTPTQAEPIPAGSNLPAEIKGPGAPLYMKLAVACSVILFLISWSIVGSNGAIGFLGWYYQILGVRDDHGIALYNVSAVKTGESATKELLVKGRIVNDSKSDREIPNVRINLLNAEKKTIKTVMLDSHEAALAPGEGVDFENRITNLPENAAIIVMDIGNGLNLAAR